MRRSLTGSVVVALLLVPAASAERRQAAARAEESYRQALSDLAAGRAETAVDRVVGLELELSDECVQAVELETAKELLALEPEALAAQAFLRVATAHARHLARAGAGNLLGFERAAIDNLERLGDLYVASSRHVEASALAAGMLTYLARGISSPRTGERLEAAEGLLERALEIDPEHRVALHARAVTLELMERPAGALRLVDRRLALDPDEPRIQLRQAVLTVKAGRRERGEELLEKLTASGLIWIRDLATQELARLLAADGRAGEAEALLRRALRELPREKLSLQLGALLDPRWTDSWRVLSTLSAAPPGDSGPSARWLYDLGADEEIGAMREELAAAVSRRLPAVREALPRLPDLAEHRHRKVEAVCR